MHGAYVKPCTFSFPKYRRAEPKFLIGDLKRFTSKIIVQAVKENAKESRKEYLLDFFLKEGSKTSNVNQYQFWRHDNKPVELWSNHVINQKINYVHQNSVEAGLVFRAEDYRYSSAVDYSDEKGLLDNILVLEYLINNIMRPHDAIVR